MVNVCILTGFGINSDYEAKYAFEKAGAANVKRIHINELIKKKCDLENYEILYFPGGFSFGDDLGSGRILANKFRYNLRDDLTKFLDADKIVLGICNGFQILVKMGVLPAFDKEYYNQTVSLIANKSDQFESRWVTLKPHKNHNIWTQDYYDNLDVPVRHGEGQFVVKNQAILDKIYEKNLISFTYDPNEYPNNPNGALDGIAGICDESGHVFGMMPHPECHIDKYQHPHWTRGFVPPINGSKIFENGVNYAKKHL